jgi:hypothetical protein
MKITLDKYPRRQGADDENSVIHLVVNGYTLGTYYGGSVKSYLNPEKWAKKQLKVRDVVIDRNIKRLEEELLKWKKEKKEIHN